uniref:SP-RING-type domain-containing protein n=1 Tax=Parascaris univalens TaxID=6257 RepID=A0A915AXV1_PARUN
DSIPIDITLWCLFPVLNEIVAATLYSGCEGSFTESGAKEASELMWSNGGTAMAVGGPVAAAQSSPSYGPMASDYANMAAMSVRSPMGGIQDMQAQQMNANAMRYSQYMHGQVASPSLMGSAAASQQSSYPVDPAGARPGCYTSHPQPTNMSSLAQSPAYEQPVMGYMQQGYGIMQQQQMIMAQSSGIQMHYRSQQQHPTMQQTRTYGQQRSLVMHQQQPLFDASMYTCGIPTATQRTPGMPGMATPMCVAPQMRQMMVPTPNGMMMHTGGAAIPQAYSRPRSSAASVSPGYPVGTTPTYPQGQSMMIRAGPPMLYSQLQHEITRQQVVAYANPNAVMRDPSDPMSRISPAFLNEPKMAVPVEVVLRQFCLDHNTTTSDYGFTLTQERFDSLRKGELDLQLKCFQHGDKKQLQQYNIWPTMPNQTNESSVKVFINNVAVPITALDRALYVGRLCVVGLNKLVITVTSCVCSHSFIMQLVNRRPIEAVVNEIFMQSRMFSPNSLVARDKLLKMIEMDGSQSRIALYFALGNCSQRLRIPARSVRCSHSSCFDLEAFLIANQDNSYFECPFSPCKSVFTLGEIEVDQFIAQILAETARMPNVLEVNLEANGCWRIIDPLPSIYPTQSQQQSTSAQNDFLQMGIQHGITANESMAARGHKRERDCADASSGGTAYSLKRIKSESFGMNGCSGSLSRQDQQQAQSPFNPNSVPAPPSSSWIQSPSGALPSVLSPYGPSTSTSPPLTQSTVQQQRCSPPSAPPKYGGPGTPATPSNAQNPPSIGPAVGTSPSSTQLQTNVPQQGSVEAVSVTGSAPYTPASVGSLSGGAHTSLSSAVACVGEGAQNAANSCLNELTSSLNVGQIDDFFDDLIFSDAKMSSAAEMQKYLNEDLFVGSGLGEINAALKCEGDVPRTSSDAQYWNDVAQVIAEQS